MNPYQPPGPQQDPTWQGHPSGPIPLPRRPTWPETPLGWSPTPPPQPPIDPGPPKRGWNTGVVVAVVVVVVLAVAGGGWFVWHRLSAPAPTDTAATATDNPAPVGSRSAGSPSAASPESGGKTLQPENSAASPSAASPAPDAEQVALGDLTALHDQSVARVPLDGRWVAQLSSKSVGITDPLQTAANGTHTFYAADILAEVQNLQATVGGSAQLYVLWGTDFGKRSTAADGSPYWTTLADAGLAGKDDVTAWCAATFPGLPADQLADQCTPRQLTAPHD